MSEEQKYYSFADVAKYLSVSKSTLRRWIEKGICPKPAIILPSGQPRFTYDQLQSFEAECQNRASSSR